MAISGRPRKSAIDDSIIHTMAQMVIAGGYSSVTVADLVAQAGTNKPAFYRRFKNLAEVVPHILIARHGTDEDIDTGSLVGDLLQVQLRQQQLFNDPVVTRGFAGWLSDIAADESKGVSFLGDYLGPRRSYTAVILQRAVDRGEIAEFGDPGWIADLLTGPLIMHSLVPGLAPIDHVLVAQTIHATLDVLGYTGLRDF